MVAPASTTALATEARIVSTETATPSATKALTTGRTRRNSSCSGVRSVPGRVDSPPTSMMSAPSTTRSRAWRMATSGSAHMPPSENELGVTLTTPMTRVRAGCELVAEPTLIMQWSLGLPRRHSSRSAGSHLLAPLTNLGDTFAVLQEITHLTGGRAGFPSIFFSDLRDQNVI